MEHSTLILRIISARIAGARRSKSKGAGNWDKAATIAPNAIRAESFRFFRSKAAYLQVNGNRYETPIIGFDVRTPRFDKYLDERKFGPGLADAKLPDRTQRFGEGFNHTVTADAMSCARCHNDQDLGALNWPMSRIVVKSFVKGGRMPPGNNLSERDRDKLYKKLIDEYFATDAANPGIFKSWLLRDWKAEPYIEQHALNLCAAIFERPRSAKLNSGYRDVNGYGRGGSSCPQDDGSWIAEGADISRRTRNPWGQRVEDNAVHLVQRLNWCEFAMQTARCSTRTASRPNLPAPSVKRRTP